MRKKWPKWNIPLHLVALCVWSRNSNTLWLTLCAKSSAACGALKFFTHSQEVCLWCRPWTTAAGCAKLLAFAQCKRKWHLVHTHTLKGDAVFCMLKKKLNSQLASFFFLHSTQHELDWKNTQVRFYRASAYHSGVISPAQFHFNLISLAASHNIKMTYNKIWKNLSAHATGAKFLLKDKLNLCAFLFSISFSIC